MEGRRASRRESGKGAAGLGDEGASTTTLPASRGPSMQSTAETGVDLDGSQPPPPPPPPPACGGGGRGQGGVKGLCVGRHGLKSSDKETSWRREEPVT